MNRLTTPLAFLEYDFKRFLLGELRKAIRNMIDSDVTFTHFTKLRIRSHNIYAHAHGSDPSTSTLQDIPLMSSFPASERTPQIHHLIWWNIDCATLQSKRITGIYIPVTMRPSNQRLPRPSINCLPACLLASLPVAKRESQSFHLAATSTSSPRIVCSRSETLPLPRHPKGIHPGFHLSICPNCF